MVRSKIETIVEECRGMYLSRELASILVDELDKAVTAEVDTNAALVTKLTDALNRIACWKLTTTTNEGAWALVLIARDTLTKLRLKP